MSVPHKRYEVLDLVRGISLISMILYHGVYDLVYIVGWDVMWYKGQMGFYWQQSICCTFIFLSGMCWSLGKQVVKRAALISLCGGMISAVTILSMPDQRVICGILTFMGMAMFVMIPLSHVLNKIPAWMVFWISILLFIVLRDINWGSIGISDQLRITLPEVLKQDGVMTFLGFPPDDFYSSDYFSLLPWLFLYMAGYAFMRIIKNQEVLTVKVAHRMPLISFIGRHTLLFYMLHQPILMAVFMAVLAIAAYI